MLALKLDLLSSLLIYDVYTLYVLYPESNAFVIVSHSRRIWVGEERSRGNDSGCDWEYPENDYGLGYFHCIIVIRNCYI